MDPHRLIEKIEYTIRRVGFPLVGIAGIVYEELSPPVDPLLLGAYLALLGFGGLGWVRDVYTRRGGGQ
jgi:hypothetical protein